MKHRHCKDICRPRPPQYQRGWLPSRRAAAENALWHDLWDQHHARSGHRHRGWSRSGFPARDARRRGSRRRASVPGVSVRSLHQGTDDDIRGDLRYLMTREPVRAETPPTTLPFPFNMRALIAVWKLLYLRAGRVPADPVRSARTGIAAPISVEGLGHCGACHTPRNALGAEQNDRYLPAARAEGWHAPALNAASPAPVPWTRRAAFQLPAQRALSHQHGVAAGPMAASGETISARRAEQDVQGDGRLCRRHDRAGHRNAGSAKREPSQTAGQLPIGSKRRRSAAERAAIAWTAQSSTPALARSATRRRGQRFSARGIHLAAQQARSRCRTRAILRMSSWTGIPPPQASPAAHDAGLRRRAYRRARLPR